MKFPEFCVILRSTKQFSTEHLVSHESSLFLQQEFSKWCPRVEIVDIDKNIISRLIQIKEATNGRCFVVNFAAHGDIGEDGHINAVMDLLNIQYCGSSLLSSSVTMHKQICKDILRANGLQTPRGIIVESKEQALEVVGDMMPCIIKPNSQGSSCGLSFVRSEADMDDLRNMKFINDSYLVEEYITGREISACIFDGKFIGVSEIVNGDDVYDYDSKYVAQDTNIKHTFEVNKEVYKTLVDISEKIYKLIYARGIIRADMIYKDNSFYILEVNSNPGFTAHSIMPVHIEAAIGMNEFSRLIIEKYYN